MEGSDMSTNKTLLMAVTLGLTALVSESAMASTWSVISPTTSPFTISYTQSNTTKNASVSYTPQAAAIRYFDDNITDQSPANIKAVTESQFGLVAGSLTYVSSCDKPTSDCTNASGGTTTGTYSNTFTSDGAFNYLAVHFGQGELLFHWASNLVAGTTFEIGGLPRGLSNYRAYTDDVSAVPLPAAAWLFGSALLGFVSLSNRRKV